MILDLAARLLAVLPAETAHDATLGFTRVLGPLLPELPPDDPRLAVKVLGLSFPNPVGLAAGFDKDARVSAALLKLGFGFVECGTVTPRPQRGNPKPRLFRLPKDQGVINRMGFNNHGMEEAARRLAFPRKGIVGINIGANKDSTARIGDYAQSFARLSPLADYVTVNVSSPNTPGLRGLQDKEELEQLLAAVTSLRSKSVHKPLLLKIAPDLDGQALDDIANVVIASGIEGVIVSNTTVQRLGLKDPHREESGGLSGKPLFQLSTGILRQMRARLPRDIVLVGVGGISSGRDAYEKIRAGASLIQLYTALVYQGPGLVGRIKQELLDLLRRDGFSTLTEAVGQG
jgi:dihydroorotate dehydrogenase